MRQCWEDPHHQEQGDREGTEGNMAPRMVGGNKNQG